VLGGEVPFKVFDQAPRFGSRSHGKQGNHRLPGFPEVTMQIDAQSTRQSAVHIDLAATFVFLELSTSTWLARQRFPQECQAPVAASNGALVNTGPLPDGSDAIQALTRF